MTIIIIIIKLNLKPESLFRTRCFVSVKKDLGEKKSNDTEGQGIRKAESLAVGDGGTPI